MKRIYNLLKILHPNFFFSHMEEFNLSVPLFPVLWASLFVRPMQFSVTKWLFCLLHTYFTLPCSQLTAFPIAIVPSFIFINPCAILRISWLWYIIQPLPSIIILFCNEMYRFAINHRHSASPTKTSCSSTYASKICKMQN